MYKNISFLEFQKMFSTERKCEKYLFKRRWKGGFRCPNCQHNKYNYHSTRKLEGLIELDDAFFGQKKYPGKRGRGSEHKATVVAAVEVLKNKKPRFAFLKQVESMSQEDLLKDINNNVKELSTFKTDAYSSYKTLKSEGYYHYPKVIDNVEVLKKHLPWIHIMISNIKNSIKATFHGVSKKHLQRYLDEFSYRFNRRFNEKQLFDRLLLASTLNSHITFAELTE